MKIHTESQNRSQGRDLSYDWLRLIATVFVVIGHSAYLTMEANYGGVYYELPADASMVYHTSRLLLFIRWMSGWVYTFHMELFFMLSGAVLALKPIGSFGKLLKGKAKRLLIPYFLCGFLFMLPVKWLSGYYGFEGLVSAYRGFPFGWDSGHLWFLTALFWCMLLFAGVKKLLDRLKIRSSLVLLAICFVMQPMASYLPFDILGLAKGLGKIFWFALGYAFETERKKAPDKNLLKGAAVCVFIGLLKILSGTFSGLEYYANVLVRSYGTFLAARLCMTLFRDFTGTGLWKLLLRNAFSVYLFHDPLEYVVLKLAFRFNWLNTAFGCYFFYFARIVLVLLISIFLGEAVAYLKKKISHLRGHKDDEIRKTAGRTGL